jgi:hypothetical protein
MLAGGDAEDILSGLASLRYPVYGKADIVIDSGAGTSAETAEAAIGVLHDYICNGSK